MSDPSKGKLLLIDKGKKNSNKAQTVTGSPIIIATGQTIYTLFDVQPLWSELLRFSASLITY